MKSVGIDIGSSSIKVAEIDGGTKENRLTRLIELPLSVDPNKDTKIEIIDHLRTLMNSYTEDASARFVICMPQEHVVTRFRKFPFRERFKILKSVAFELEDDIPFQQEDAIFDVKVLRYTGKTADVLAMACPKAHVREALSLAQDCGIDPYVLSVEGPSLANLFENWNAAPLERPADYQATPEAVSGKIVVDIGHKKTTVLAFVEDSLAAVRIIDWGVREIAHEVSVRYNLHIVEALKEVQKKAFILLNHEGATGDQIIFSDTIKKALEPMIQKLHLMHLDLQAEFNANYSALTLLGGGSQIRQLAPYITQRLELNCNRLKSLEGLGGLEVPLELSQSPKSLLAIGLALEGLKKPRNPALNLIRDEFVKQSPVLQLFWERWGHTTLVAASAFVLLLIYGMAKETLATRLLEVTSETLKTQAQSVAGLTGLQASKKSIRNYIKTQEKNAKMREAAEIIFSYNSATDILKSIAQKIPNVGDSRKIMPMDILSLKIVGENVEIAGRIPSTMNVDVLVKALTDLGTGKVETYTPPAPEKSGQKNFGIRLQVKRKLGNKS